MCRRDCLKYLIYLVLNTVDFIERNGIVYLILSSVPEVLVSLGSFQ